MLLIIIQEYYIIFPTLISYTSEVHSYVQIIIKIVFI